MSELIAPLRAGYQMPEPKLQRAEDPQSDPPIEAKSQTPDGTAPTAAADASRMSLEQIQDKLISRRQTQCPQELADPFIDRLPAWKQWRKPIITAFLAWNLIAIGFHLCAPSMFVDRVCAFVNPYLWYTGLWQNFCVFVPDPKDYNIHMTANVFMKNGQAITYKFPNPADDNYLVRMSTERYRKWAHDNVNQPNYKVWWPDTCKWIARKYMRDPNNQPVKVELIRNFQEIKPPGSKELFGPMQSSGFYTYVLQPGDL
jgi:hypothetical protein